MFENVRNVEIHNISNMIATYNQTTHTSLNHVFTLRTGGAASYDYNGKIITTYPGDMIFKPKGSTCVFTRLSEEVCTSTCIIFDADIDGADPMHFQLDTFPEKNYISKELANMWAIGNDYEKYKCISLFYLLLSYLSKVEYENNYDDSTEVLKPAEEYLKEHIFDSSLTIDKLYTLCEISDTHFRKLFFKKYRCLPRKYIVDKRISYAKTILESNPVQSVKEVAYSVGFGDPLYFSRVFREKYNISPKNVHWAIKQGIDTYTKEDL